MEARTLYDRHLPAFNYVFVSRRKKETERLNHRLRDRRGDVWGGGEAEETV